MDAVGPSITFILDECMPLASFRTFLEQRGHTVYGVGEAFPSGSPDQSVLAAAEQLSAVVVSTDFHWRGLLNQAAPGNKARTRRAGRVLFNCDHHVAIDRLAALIDVIEREYELAQRAGRRLMMRISEGEFRVER